MHHWIGHLEVMVISGDQLWIEPVYINKYPIHRKNRDLAEILTVESKLFFKLTRVQIPSTVFSIQNNSHLRVPTFPDWQSDSLTFPVSSTRVKSHYFFNVFSDMNI